MFIYYLWFLDFTVNADNDSLIVARIVKVSVILVFTS